mmetsp:Transcript_26186/g.40139  ORF Transcript_26186/g.40139 Transcript_26186/m.40139 type:complete len:336 (+) Transcript_26186:221-1228(+)|eukprot:CAMPEP_0118685298 /NCGR_PEP_ID=MMETSP0800-20121206/7158_1 /TAXON_ID=210618 ORGANISM="Striatella unipunctata, Strain CCMP2910" /NCGR_SAMPLE_ID=MMETSP0800 /ASSEMBLY_ACC=CAM_ASM_000638 /LENGTH=335 /DNA_ID=CAMNT_0006582173 /DNA_START=299 /DNA_END=1306 /DNA_ORIENTATION=-
MGTTSQNANTLSPTSKRLRISVNVALCGSIPRSHFESKIPQANVKPTKIEDVPSRKGLSDLTSKINTIPDSQPNDSNNSCLCLEDSIVQTIIHQDCRADHRPAVIEPPSWAVAAPVQCYLEPVCEARESHKAVDLGTRRHYRVGRSPSCDIHLHHGTSSRRHAMIFHHPNGSCYVVDTGSAHGTYVNGNRVQSIMLASGMVVPHRVRRGALIRFGGPGAPSFVLKTLTVGMSKVLKDEMDVIPTSHPSLSPQTQGTSIFLDSELKHLNSRLRECESGDSDSDSEKRTSSPIPGSILRKRSKDEDDISCTRKRRKVSFTSLIDDDDQSATDSSETQ